MFEMPKAWVKMDEVFGSDARLLRRNDLFSVESVKEYIEKYPFAEYEKHHATHYKYIGPVKYNRIVEALKKWEGGL